MKSKVKISLFSLTIISALVSLVLFKTFKDLGKIQDVFDIEMED